LIFVLTEVGYAQQNVLFVVGNTSLSTSDQAIHDRLALTFDTVTIKDDGASASGDASGKDLIFISSTITSTDVNTKFTTSAVPLINCEHAFHDDLKMTGNSGGGSDHGSQSSVTQLSIHNSSHPMAASLSSTVTVHTSSQSVNWGLPNSNGVKVATVVSDTNKVVIFGYENGASMVGGTAPARRVGFYFGDNSAQYWNSNGQALFDAAIDWALGIIGVNNPPAVSITSPETNDVFGATEDIPITATASDSDGTISQVEFFYGSTSLGMDTSSPYSISWENVTVGTYSLTAVATDDGDSVTISEAINISVLQEGEIGNTLRHDGEQWVADSNLYSDGINVGIGTITPRGKLDVNGLVVIGEQLYGDTILTYGNTVMLSVDGGIVAKEVLVSQSDWADYVFSDAYKLPSLDSVNLFVLRNSRLPGVPSAQDVKQNGINLGEMNVILLKKIEEMTLYVLEQNRRIIPKVVRKSNT